MEHLEETRQGEGFKRIVAHDDFDGVVSAALCSLAEGIDEFRFSGPVGILDIGLGVAADTIVCDLPHHPAAGMWFDHHVGNLQDYQLKGGDPSSIKGSFAPERSCARVVHNYYQGKVAFPGFMEDTVREADTIDSYDYEGISDWQRRTPGKILTDTIMISFGSRQARHGYMRHLIRKIREAPLAGILEDPQVAERAKSYEETAEKNRVLIEKIGSFLPGDAGREVIVLDTTLLKHAPNLIKSLAFLRFPEASAVLEVRSLFQQKRKTNDLAFSMSLSPCLDVKTSGKDIGEIMRMLNMGDGHPGAGAGRIPCRSKADREKTKEETIEKVLALWCKQRPPETSTETSAAE